MPIQPAAASSDLGPGVRPDEPCLEAHAILDRRLSRDNPRPIAVALSGGGDSLALTLVADAWAHARGRELVILSVDHRLQPDSAAWTDACAGLAERLGRPFRTLSWEGEKPATGLPAAARRARHGLLADAARAAGARVVLMGHTRDDLAEAQAMRAQGSTLPDAREWSPSPVWPQGRGVFLLRPLLGVRRADLRAWLNERGETWIEDPANADLRYARSRARAAEPALVASEPVAPVAPGLPIVEDGGALVARRSRLRAEPLELVRRVVAIACVCAGGGERLPARARVARAAEAILGPADFVSTLAGARIDARGDVVRIAREPGEAARGGLQPLELPVGREVVWDGRFALTAQASGLVVRPTRSGTPSIGWRDGAICGGTPEVAITALVRDRFRAAAGLVPREPD